MLLGLVVWDDFLGSHKLQGQFEENPQPKLPLPLPQWRAPVVFKISLLRHIYHDKLKLMHRQTEGLLI